MALHDVWEGKPNLVGRFLAKRQLSKQLSMDWDGVRAGDELREDSVLQPFVLHPWRPKIMIWDAVVGVVTVYDLIVVPLQVFPLTHTSLYAMDLMTAWVWTSDLVVNFLRGRDIGGVIDMRPSKIAMRYLRTWFVLDFPVAAMDWILVIASTTKLDVIRSVRLRRLLRLVRVTRILRVTKIVRSVRRSRNNLTISDYTEAFKSVIKFLLTMYVVNHYVACGWYAIGNVGITPNWVAKAFDESDSIPFRYATAYHWSLTQFTPASMEVVPTNAIERAYSVGAIFFGLVMFTSFVSHMTNAVMRIQVLNAEKDKSRRDVRKYVQHHQVSFALSKKIEAYVRTANKRMKKMRLLESDVTVLRMLPENLLTKLREEVFEPSLTGHPFFEKLHGAEKSVFVSICNLAAAEKIVLLGEELFRCGQTATKMYISTAGGLSYFHGFDGYNDEVVPEGSWFSEAALWCNWSHKGRMMSCDDLAEIVMVGAAELHSIISASGSFYQVQRYARMYCTLAVSDCGSKERIVDTWGGPYWVHKAIRHAWSPSVFGSANTVLSLWLSGEDWYVDVFDAWKTYTMAAVKTRKHNQGLLQMALFALLPATAKRSLARAQQSSSFDS